MNPRVDGTERGKSLLAARTISRIFGEGSALMALARLDFDCNDRLGGGTCNTTGRADGSVVKDDLRVTGPERASRQTLHGTPNMAHTININKVSCTDGISANRTALCATWSSLSRWATWRAASPVVRVRSGDHVVRYRAEQLARAGPPHPILFDDHFHLGAAFIELGDAIRLVLECLALDVIRLPEGHQDQVGILLDRSGLCANDACGAACSRSSRPRG